MDYHLEKKVWTEADFGQMGWHDSSIYKIRLTGDLELDIDYILQWNKPDIEGMPFTFWISPATLIFKSIHDFSFAFNVFFEETFLIADIQRTEDRKEYIWSIITRQGNFQFKSEGYEQFIRQDPSFEFGQTISYDRRGGYSLERTTNQENSQKKASKDTRTVTASRSQQKSRNRHETIPSEKKGNQRVDFLLRSLFERDKI